jgi:hypothetical protein
MVERPLVFIPGLLGSTLAIEDVVFWPPTNFSSTTVSDVLAKLGTKVIKIIFLSVTAYRAMKTTWINLLTLRVQYWSNSSAELLL